MAGEREAADIEDITGANPGGDQEGQENREQPAENFEGSGGEASPDGGDPQGQADPKADDLKPTTPKWMKDRIDRATRQRGDAERARDAEKARAEKAEKDNQRLRALLESGGTPDPNPPTPAAPAKDPAAPVTADDIERRAAEIADQRAQQQRVQAESARVMSEGAKEFGADKWEAARSDFVGNFSDELAARPDFFDALFGVEGGHKVFYELANNPDEAARILALSPARMGIEVAKMAGAPAPTRRISAAPTPPTPLNGSARVTKSVLDTDISMDDFIAQREQQIAARNGR